MIIDEALKTLMGRVLAMGLNEKQIGIINNNCVWSIIKSAFLP